MERLLLISLMQGYNAKDQVMQREVENTEYGDKKNIRTHNFTFMTWQWISPLSGQGQGMQQRLHNSTYLMQEIYWRSER